MIHHHYVGTESHDTEPYGFLKSDDQTFCLPCTLYTHSIMKVKVTTLTEDKHELEVAPQDTVRNLKVSKLACCKFTLLAK